MFGGIVSGLICAWILVQFDVDNICINVELYNNRSTMEKQI